MTTNRQKGNYYARRSNYIPESHIKVKCVQCGKYVEKIRCWLKKVKNPFCGRECYRLWLKENSFGDKNYHYKNASKEYVCIKCGEKFKSYAKNRIHCSYRCSSMSKNLKAIGSSVEREVFKILKERGFYVIKSAGSLGLFDIWAVNDKELKLIQVKSVHKKINPTIVFREEIEKIRQAKCIGNKEFWVRFLINKKTNSLIERFEIINIK